MNLVTRERMMRNMEDLWRQVFSVGTEWEAMDKIYESNWDFTNLENAFEEGGELHGQNVHLFACTETKGIANASLVPVVVAVVSQFPPSDKIAIASVQRGEQILPMKQFKMDWFPYIPEGRRDAKVEDLKNCRIFLLRCKQRKAGLKHLGIDRRKMYDYCLPYFYNPLKKDEDDQQETEVQILFPREPEPPLTCSFDWELDVPEEFADELIKQEALAAEQKNAFKDFVMEKVREAKKAQREAREAKEKMLQVMNEETRAAYQSMRLYKFYPVSPPGYPEIVKSSFINRYYGNALKVL